ncbi:MAG TPA: hypothetical protein VHE60_08450 [Pyrinomonadaceae bacterium]|nr:hypothetical protein [Pyrinomonadaceae bacterium]
MDSRDKVRFATKCICVPFLFLLAAGASLGQESSGAAAPNIEIVKLKWERQVRLPRNFDPSVIPTNGSFVDPALRTSAAAPTSALDATRAATSARSAAAGASAEFPSTPSRLPVFYVYSMKIRNVGGKQIEGIAWDYVFIDPNGGAELGRHQFLSYVKAQPNKDVTLKGQMRTPPLRIVLASSTEKHPKPIERAAIQCVLFEDETVWRNPAGRKDVCEFLKSSGTLMKQKRSATQH